MLAFSTKKATLGAFMFIGHYGVALAAKAASPDTPLPALMISTQLIDIVFCILVLAKVEKLEIDPNANPTVPIRTPYIPFSHGLESAIVLSVLCAFGAGVIYTDLTTQALWLIALVCFSHWLIDVVMHVGDVPVAFNRYKIGLGLWNYRKISICLELGLIAFGTVMLANAGVVASWKVWCVGAVMLAGQTYSFFAPPPEPANRLVGSMIVLYAIMTWAGWWIETP